MKKLTVALMGMVFIVGCGGSGGEKSKTITEQIEERDFINILYNYPEELCGDELKNLMISNGYKDPLVVPMKDFVTCASYGREKGGSCNEFYEGFNTLDNCVGAWNR